MGTLRKKLLKKLKIFHKVPLGAENVDSINKYKEGENAQGVRPRTVPPQGIIPDSMINRDTSTRDRACVRA